MAVDRTVGVVEFTDWDGRLVVNELPDVVVEEKSVVEVPAIFSLFGSMGRVPEVSVRSWHTVSILKVSPTLEGLRSKLRFSAQLVKERNSPKKTRAPGITKCYRLPGNYPQLLFTADYCV